MNEKNPLSDRELMEQIPDLLRSGDGKINATQLQCRFNIGYARAARLLDALAAENKLMKRTYYVLPPTEIRDDDDA